MTLCCSEKQAKQASVLFQDYFSIISKVQNLR